MRNADMDLVLKKEILVALAYAIEAYQLAEVTHVSNRVAAATDFVDEVIYLEWKGEPVYLKIA